ncbi:MAG: hypothetical protein ACNA7H_04790, partial [Desulfotignum sp.]
ISTQWSRVLAAYGIIHVKDLARLDDPLLLKIISESNSLQVRKFRQKVLLLKIPVPSLPVSAVGDKSLYDLLKTSMAVVQQSFSRSVTPGEVAALFEMLDILNLVVDSYLLRRITLHQLLDS